MKQHLLISGLILLSTLPVFGMNTALNPDLPLEVMVGIVAACNGKTKNMLAQTCKLLFALLGEKKALLQHRLINLGPIEKHLLLLEYVEQGNANMVKTMFALGATQKVLNLFGEEQDPLPCSGRRSTVYVPYLQSFPKHRIPHACIDQQRTLLHVAVVKKQHDIAKILLDHMQEQKTTSINTPDAKGNTSLTLAVTNKDEAMIELLLKYMSQKTNQPRQ